MQVQLPFFAKAVLDSNACTHSDGVARPAVFGGPVTSLQAMHDAFRRANVGNLKFANVGSLSAALAEFG